VATDPIQTDYLVVGAGATGMAFSDTLLTETDANIVMVDRHDRPGGHWNDAYPFVRLHQPAAYYGVNSLPLGQATKDSVGLNAGLLDLASGQEVVAYFDQLMNQRFLASGRVHYFPMCNAVGDDQFESLLTGERRRIAVRCKVVDATYSDIAVPSTHLPKYPVAPGVRCMPLNQLPNIRQPQGDFVVVGSGKTGIDACLWLLQNGVPPAKIRWVMPRDAWLLDRRNVQPGDEFFMAAFGSLANQFEALVAATSVRDLFERLNASGELLRIDQRIVPSIYRCATVTRAELEQLRRIQGMVRLGHVLAVETAQIVLEHGCVPMLPDTLVVDCSASALRQRPPLPIFDGRRITLQFVRTCQPTFSAAFIAHVEATFEDDAEKNALCTPVPVPYLDTDWLRMLFVTANNQHRWAQHPGLDRWLAQSRLDSFFDSLRKVQPGDTEKVAVVKRYRSAIKPALVNLEKLLATTVAPGSDGFRS